MTFVRTARENRDGGEDDPVWRTLVNLILIVQTSGRRTREILISKATEIFFYLHTKYCILSSIPIDYVF